MKRAGVIGYPLGHSISPAVFAAAFEAAGIEGAYEAWPTTEEQLEGRINALRGDDMLGANVTVPHKEAVIPMLDRLDERAERVGAVNTIVAKNGELAGHNTDVGGFARALRDDAGFDPRGRRTAVLGAGGAARAVAQVLVEAGASIVLLAGRSPRRLEGVTANLRANTPSGTTITWCHWEDGVFMSHIPKAHLLVNCTPVGVKGSETVGRSPIDAKWLPEGGVVFDLVYNPTETPLLAAAKERGATPVSGLGMLIYQAAESFALWTGAEAPVEAMLEAGRKALAEG